MDPESVLERITLRPLPPAHLSPCCCKCTREAFSFPYVPHAATARSRPRRFRPRPRDRGRRSPAPGLQRESASLEKASGASLATAVRLSFCSLSTWEGGTGFVEDGRCGLCVGDEVVGEVDGMEDSEVCANGKMGAFESRAVYGVCFMLLIVSRVESSWGVSSLNFSSALKTGRIRADSSDCRESLSSRSPRRSTVVR